MDLIDLNQYRIAMISEMIHTASLVHDDVIDESDRRRGQPTVNARWGNRQVSRAHAQIIAPMPSLGRARRRLYSRESHEGPLHDRPAEGDLCDGRDRRGSRKGRINAAHRTKYAVRPTISFGTVLFLI